MQTDVFTKLFVPEWLLGDLVHLNKHRNQHLVSPKGSPHNKKKTALLWIVAEPPWPAFPLFLWTSLRNFFSGLISSRQKFIKKCGFWSSPFPFSWKMSKPTLKKFLKRFGFGYSPPLSLKVSKLKLKKFLDRFGRQKFILKFVFICQVFVGNFG